MSSSSDSVSTNSRVTGILVLIIGLIVAGVAGVWVGEENWMPLGFVLGGSAIAGLILGLKENWWVVIPWMISLGFSSFALGFRLTGVDIAALLAFGIIALRIALHTRSTQPISLHLPRIFYVLCSYVILHAVLVLVYERYGGDNQIKNIVKAYYQAVTPLVLIWMMSVYATSNSARIATTGMIIISIPAFLVGIIVTYLQTYISFLSHPYFMFDWASPDAFGHIRWLSVSFFLLSLCLSTTTASFFLKSIYYSCATIALAGAFLGGGRVALASCILAGCLWLLLRKNAVALFGGGAFFLLLIAAINLDSNVTEALPRTVQRSMTPLVFSGALTSEQSATESSDQWHSDLRKESWDYWQESPTSIFLGHGYKGWDDNIDIKTFVTGPLYESAKKIAIQMGRTERSFSSMLVIFGAVGVVLYYSFMLALLIRLWKLRRLTPKNSYPRAMSEFSLSMLLISFATTFHAGGVPSYEMIFWFIGILATREYVPILLGKKSPNLSNRTAAISDPIHKEGMIPPTHSA